MMENSFEKFVKNNEIRVNSLISKISFLFIPVFPLLSIFKILGISSQLNVWFLLLFSVITAVFCFTFRFIITKFPDKPGNKYIALLFIDIVVFLLSILNGVNLYITYVIVILISCLYWDHFFTFHVETMAFIVMMISFSIREVISVDQLVEFSGSDGGIFHSISAAIEFILYSFLGFYFSFSIRKTVISIFERKTSFANVQNQLSRGFANIVEAKDESTGEHIRRTSAYVWLICLKLRQNNIYPEFVDEHTSDLMVRAAPFHDLGKISISDEILNKKGALTEEEIGIMQYHPWYGAEFIVKKMHVIGDSELITMARDMALCHHEHLDGTGYPNRLIEDEIPISARIMAIADVLDALLSKRSYKEALSLNEAFRIIQSMSGTALDPKIVELLLKCDTEIRMIRDGGLVLDEDFV